MNVFMNVFIIIAVSLFILLIVFSVSGVLGCMFESDEFYIGGWVITCFSTTVMIVLYLIEKGLLAI